VCMSVCMHVCVRNISTESNFITMLVNNDSTLDYVPTSKDSITTKECVDINGWTLRDKYVLNMPYM